LANKDDYNICVHIFLIEWLLVSLTDNVTQNYLPIP